MREFAKSAMSLSWALSLLGINSAVNLVRPDRQKNTDGFAPLTEVVVNQLDETMRGVYRCGDNIQSKVVDTAFSWINPASWTKMVPTNFMRSNCSNQRSGSQQQAAPNPGAQQPPAAKDSYEGSGEAATGWGPMPAK